MSHIADPLALRYPFGQLSRDQAISFLDGSRDGRSFVNFLRCQSAPWRIDIVLAGLEMSFQGDWFTAYLPDTSYSLHSRFPTNGSLFSDLRGRFDLAPEATPSPPLYPCVRDPFLPRSDSILGNPFPGRGIVDHPEDGLTLDDLRVADPVLPDSMSLRLLSANALAVADRGNPFGLSPPAGDEDLPHIYEELRTPPPSYEESLEMISETTTREDPVQVFSLTSAIVSPESADTSSDIIVLETVIEDDPSALVAGSVIEDPENSPNLESPQDTAISRSHSWMEEFLQDRFPPSPPASRRSWRVLKKSVTKYFKRT